MKNARDSEGHGVKPRQLGLKPNVAPPLPVDRPCGSDRLLRAFLPGRVSRAYPTPVRTWIRFGLRFCFSHGMRRAKNWLFFHATRARTRLVCPGHGSHIPIELIMHDRCNRHL